MSFLLSEVWEQLLVAAQAACGDAVFTGIDPDTTGQEKVGEGADTDTLFQKLDAEEEKPW